MTFTYSCINAASQHSSRSNGIISCHRNFWRACRILKVTFTYSLVTTQTFPSVKSSKLTHRLYTIYYSGKTDHMYKRDDRIPELDKQMDRPRDRSIKIHTLSPKGFGWMHK